MNDSELDQLVAATSPITDADVHVLPLAGADVELCEEIMSTPVIHAAEEADVSPTPAGRGRARALRRWLAAAASLAAVSAAVAVVQPFGSDGGDRAWGAELVRVAESSPRLLVTADGWSVTRADELSEGWGDMTFTGPEGELWLDWITPDALEDFDHDARLDDLHDDPFTRLDDVVIAGHEAALFEAPGDPAHVTALWEDGRYSVELNTEMSVDDFLAVAGTIEAVDVDTWLSAMPASVVHASQRAAVVDEMLADIPVPSGFDAGSVELADVAVTDRYQLGAHVTGQVACAWFAQWAEATRTGDAAAAAEAVDAMAGSRDWDILREMAGQGDWPVAVWEYADELVAGADDVVEATAGLEGSSPIEQRAAHGLGCDWAEPPTRPVG